MIRHYAGTYLAEPAPIHFGLNWCSNNCYYCFANLNKPKRRADYRKTLAFIKKVQSQKPGKDISIFRHQDFYVVIENDEVLRDEEGREVLAYAPGHHDKGNLVIDTGDCDYFLF